MLPQTPDWRSAESSALELGLFHSGSDAWRNLNTEREVTPSTRWLTSWHAAATTADLNSLPSKHTHTPSNPSTAEKEPKTSRKGPGEGGGGGTKIVAHTDGSESSRARRSLNSLTPDSKYGMYCYNAQRLE